VVDDHSDFLINEFFDPKPRLSILDHITVQLSLLPLLILKGKLLIVPACNKGTNIKLGKSVPVYDCPVHFVSGQPKPIGVDLLLID
jgi:hypothetical protein